MRNNRFGALQPPARIGIIGGGQLGRMMAMEAKRMGYYVMVLDPTVGSPAGQVADEELNASFSDRSAIRRLAEWTDVLTYEFEHIDSDILIELEKEGYKVYPTGGTLKKIQNKYLQKKMLSEAGLPIPKMYKVESQEDIAASGRMLGYPLVLKTCTGGYDGKGNLVIKNEAEIHEALKTFQGQELMVEEYISFERELSILAARNHHGITTFYPVVENVHEESVLRYTKAPAVLDAAVEEKIKQVALGVLEVLSDFGVFCIELFITPKGEIYINEIAPRPHNSAHYTIEGCITSQFEQLIRIITGMPLGSPRLISPCVMANILGNDEVKGKYTFEGISDILAMEGVYLHLYGKKTTDHLRKIGHITVLHENAGEAQRLAEGALNILKFKSLEVEK